MKSVVFFIGVCLYTGSPAYAQQARRTAPRRTTVQGGTYGTETFATVTEAPTTASSVTQASQPLPVGVIAQPFPVAQPGAGGVINGGMIAAGVPVTSLLGGVVPGGIPVSQVLGIAAFGNNNPFLGRVTKKAYPAYTGKFYTTQHTDLNDDDIPGETGPKGAKGKHVPTQNLCEEVEEILKPGTTEQECWTGDPMTLRFWQPYRALRSVRCKHNGNDTSDTSPNTDQCPAMYPGAKCLQKYQQFVVLAAMGPAQSGWACVRLPSGCSCSVRATSRLRKTDTEQRTDLREFLKS